MRRTTVLFLLLIVVTALAGCYGKPHATSGEITNNEGDRAISSASAPTPRARSRAETFDAVSTQTPNVAPNKQPTPLDSATSAQTAAQAAERKIIRNAEITIETDAPNEGQQKIAAIAEKHGGFVVISESRQNDARSQTAPATVVNVIVRVPAQKFAAAIEEIRGVGGRILHEKISGQDVTEEYIDLEARIRSKRALEAQFLEIMKQARKVSDALEVQTQLADVRTEIEQIEGRRRFLENQSALSTINIALHTPTPVVAATTRGFFHEIKAAFGDGVDTGAEIILGIIRFVIVMIPVTLFILLPSWFAFKWLRRRITWPVRRAAAPATSPIE